MDVKGKIEIIFGDEEAEIYVEKNTASWGEVVNALTNGVAEFLRSILRPEKLDEATMIFCSNLTELVKRKSERDD